MAHIRTKKSRGKIYYYLVEKKKGKVKTLESYGTSPPVKYKPLLIKGFAEAELKNIPDESVDLIIIDPPYAIEYNTNHRKETPDTLGEISLDNEKIFETFPDVVRECYRILKNNSAIYVFTRWDVAGKFIDILNKYFNVKNSLSWIKNNWSMGDLTGSYASQKEEIIFAVKGRHILKGRRDTDVLKFSRVSGKKLLHSHQKPTDLLDFLIEKSSKRGDTVLDCYAGSGSTIISATNLGRKAICIELNEKHISIIKKRLEEECYLKTKGINWKDLNTTTTIKENETQM